MITTAPDIMTPEQVAEALQVHIGTLERWRFLGQGPRFIKMGEGRRSAIRYRKQDVDDWLLGNMK
ncbi:MAG: helix-turn-helix transcriptional regulator [Betaproteobacteria bacterium]|jgi:hypothetical protein